MSNKVSVTPNNLPERNYGIDLLRIVAMFMVVVLHVLKNGGVLNASNTISETHFKAAWFLEIAAYSAVNIYALISGYVSCNSKARASKVMTLKFQTSFWALAIVAIFKFCPPVSPINEEIAFKHWFNALFPFMTNMYWYVTAYFGLMLFKPILDAAINNISKSNFYVFAVGVFFFFLLLPVNIEYIKISSLGISNGYNMLWLIILYIIGGGFKRFNTINKIPVWLSVLIAIGSVIYTWIGKFYLNKAHLVSYTSPTVFLSAIGIFCVFSKIKIKHSITKKLISLFSAATLGVYIIHVNPFVWNNLLYNSMVHLVNSTWYIMLLRVLFNAFKIFMLCAVLDIIRGKLFELLRVKKLGAFIDDKIKLAVKQ